MAMSTKNLARWLDEEVEFLKENQDYTGGYAQLGNGLAAVVLWSPGFGDDERDDVIQAEDNRDYALCAGIKVYNPSDTPDGWTMLSDKEGNILTDEISIIPDEDYTALAKSLLDEFSRFETADYDEDGVVTGGIKEVGAKKDESIKKHSMKEGLDDKAVEYWVNEVMFQLEENDDLATDERIVNASEKELKELAERVAHEIIYNSDNLWGNINETIEWCIYHDDFMEGNSKDESMNLKEDSSQLHYGDIVRIKGRKDKTLYMITDASIQPNGDKMYNLVDASNPHSEILEEPFYDYELELVKRDNSKKESLKESNGTELDSLGETNKNIVGEYFDHTWDFDFLDIVAKVVSRVDDYGDEDDIWGALDTTVLSTNEEWEIAKYYAGSPSNLDWNEVMVQFNDDIFAICGRIHEAEADGEDEEDEDEEE